MEYNLDTFRQQLLYVQHLSAKDRFDRFGISATETEATEDELTTHLRIIDAMTDAERRSPAMVDAERRSQITSFSKVDPEQVQSLILMVSALQTALEDARRKLAQMNRRQPPEDDEEA